MSSSSAWRVWPLALLLATTANAEPDSLPLTAGHFAAAPRIDGDLDDWPSDEWLVVPLQPAIDDDPENTTGRIDAKLQIRVHGGRLYLAARWPDASEDRVYRSWRWSGSKYRRGRERDDMFAVRFDFGGDFDACMLAETSYKVDVWTWSAGRSDPAGLGEDSWHEISTRPITDAAEHKGPGGRTVYIKKHRDTGERAYRYTRPARRKNQGPKLPGVEWPGASGSAADVQGKGVWRDGEWSLELTRLLDTGNADDVVLGAANTIRMQIAVFNHNHDDHKSISPVVSLQFPEPGRP